MSSLTKSNNSSNCSGGHSCEACVHVYVTMQNATRPLAYCRHPLVAYIATLVEPTSLFFVVLLLPLRQRRPQLQLRRPRRCHRSSEFSANFTLININYRNYSYYTCIYFCLALSFCCLGVPTGQRSRPPASLAWKCCSCTDGCNKIK